MYKFDINEAERVNLENAIREIDVEFPEGFKKGYINLIEKLTLKTLV